MRLSDLKVGQKARITAILTGDIVYRHRIMAMGLLPGTLIKLIRVAPLGDPIAILVRGVALSLRKLEASILQLEEA